jgi:hypothetical protein
LTRASGKGEGKIAVCAACNVNEKVPRVEGEEERVISEKV